MVLGSLAPMNIRYTVLESENFTFRQTGCPSVHRTVLYMLPTSSECGPTSFPPKMFFLSAFQNSLQGSVSNLAGFINRTK